MHSSSCCVGRAAVWQDLCRRFEYADPAEPNNTATKVLLDKLRQIRELGLIRFDDDGEAEFATPTSDITTTQLWSKIRVAFGGIRTHEASV